MGKRFRILAGDFDIYPNVTDFEIVTEENVKHLSGTLGGALVGGLFLGGTGTLVGALVGGEDKEITIVATFKGEKKALVKVNSAMLEQLHKQVFSANLRAERGELTFSERHGSILNPIGQAIALFLMVTTGFVLIPAGITQHMGSLSIMGSVLFLVSLGLLNEFRKRMNKLITRFSKIMIALIILLNAAILVGVMSNSEETSETQQVNQASPSR